MQNKLNPFWRFFLILYSFLFLNALSLSHSLSRINNTREYQQLNMHS